MWIQTPEGNSYQDFGPIMIHVERDKSLDASRCWTWVIEWTDPTDDCNEDIPDCNAIIKCEHPCTTPNYAQGEAMIAYRAWMRAHMESELLPDE